ncbi:LacI family DNA-binding transcriptional regulator [Limimaricola cinnabarinus]|uniref:Transcriptional regulator, LacI family n=1 Tax=Limimaricola cinnabarinus LL-001 TaxID=1337093 RepID=U2Z6H9_9RHOB|nr:LacI family DNA-binding transcriptional regulator [Limimaricola cinnabarinus]GAD56677.1 transcriptional regulator, LacI family [Limimaricola cinnabarinus LL-001]
MPDDPASRDKRPTIADVARRAGVAPAIVSRALSPVRRPVSQEKRERVLKAAAELGYNQNPLARGLATKSLDLVAVLVNHLNDLSDLDLIDPLLERIQALGKQAVLIRVGETRRIEDFLRNSVAYHVHAALVFSDFADAQTVRELFHSDNVLMLNGRADLQSARIVVDDAAGIAAAVERAAAQGARRAVLVTGRDSSLVEQARCGFYRNHCAASGIVIAREIQGDYSYASGLKAAAGIDPKDVPDVVFCTSDSMAMGVMDGMRPTGLRPPQDYLLYGFDALSRSNFDAYDISTIGFDKGVLIERVALFLKDPAGFSARGELHEIRTGFVPRGTG